MFSRRRTRLDEEMEAHVAAETADNIDRGMDAVSARAAALRTFGNVEAAKERVRELEPLYWADTLWQDVRFSLRLIARSPWTSATVIATLTVGIALNVSVFSLLNGLLLRPWIRAEPETFVSLLPRYSGKYDLRYSDGGMSQPDYAFYRDSAASLQSLAAYRLRNMTLSGSEAGIMRGGLISCNLFEVVRPGPPILGRYPAAEECASPPGASVAVLAETAWRSTFAADPAVIGRTIHLNRVPFTVIGVAPAFTLSGSGGGPPRERDVWVPYSTLPRLNAADDFFGDPRAQWLVVVGRRHQHVPLRQVQEELSVLARSADSRVPGRMTALTVTDGSLLQDPDMRARAPIVMTLTLGTTVLLLILASVNVTTLLLSRAAAREREMAVRLSLGAGRFRLIRQLLTESLVLSGIALAASVAVAQRAPAALWYSITSAQAPIDLSPDWRVILFALALGLAAGVMAGLSPAVESLRPGTAEALKGSSSAATAAPRRTRLRSVLVAVQIALSLLLVVEAALFARAHRRFFAYDPGFDTHQVLSLSLASVLSGYAPPRAFYDDLAVRVNALPGVVQSSFASIAPWSGRNSAGIAEIDGVPVAKTGDSRRDPARRVVSADFFATLRIPVVRGRAFTADEARSQAPDRTVPAVVSEAMARRYWPGQDALGRSFRAGALHEVIGIAADVQSVSYMQDDGPFFYAPLDPQRSRPPSMLIRVGGGAEPVIAAVRGIVHQLDPQMAATVTTLAAVIEDHGRRRQPLMMYGAAAGVLALLLALTGVYGVVSYMVSGRVREIGIRLALGARRGEVIRLIVRSGAVPVCGGLLIGLALAVLASRVTSAVLFGVNPRDPLTLAAGALVVLLCALAAIWIPARRAASLDPLTLLRSE